MLQNFIWDAFRNTGDIQAYLLYKEIEKYSADKQEEEQIMESQVPVEL